MKIDYNTYMSRGYNFRQRFLILHYTADNFRRSVNTLTSRNVSSHYLIPTLKKIDPTYPNEELVVYSLVSEERRAWHAGVSSWVRRTNLNDSSIGIEIVNQATEKRFLPYPEEQIKLVIKLCQSIVDRYDIAPNNVLGHSDISVSRKIDPGPLFPWKKLYDAGVGAWYDKATFNKYKKMFEKNLPSISEVASKLNRYGYVYTGSETNLLKAFQMHFRPSNYSGKLDAQTAAAAYALVDKYIDKA